MIESLKGIHETIQYGESSHFRLHRNIYNEDYPPHWHVGIEIIIPIQNWYKVHIGNDHYTLNENDILFINSGVIHSLESPENGERIILQFDLSLLCDLKEFDTTLFMLPSAVKITEKEFPQIHPTIHTQLLNIIQEYNLDTPLKEASIYANLIQIYVALCRKIIYDQNFFKNTAVSKRHEYIEKLMKTCHYINQHSNEELSLESIASIAGFSKYHFARLFKEFTNMTFHQYLTKQRLKKSEVLLMDTDLSIMDVALTSGFNSISNFNRSFRKSKGCSANEFRKKRVDHGLGFY